MRFSTREISAATEALGHRVSHCTAWFYVRGKPVSPVKKAVIEAAIESLDRRRNLEKLSMQTGERAFRSRWEEDHAAIS